MTLLVASSSLKITKTSDDVEKVGLTFIIPSIYCCCCLLLVGDYIVRLASVAAAGDDGKRAGPAQVNRGELLGQAALEGVPCSPPRKGAQPCSETSQS